jgi:hypothetical protein
MLDRSDGEMKDGSDLSVRVTDREEFCDFDLSRRKRPLPRFSSRPRLFASGRGHCGRRSADPTVDAWIFIVDRARVG